MSHSNWKNIDVVSKGNRLRVLWRNVSIGWMLVEYVITVLAFASSIATLCVEVFIDNNTLYIVALSIFSATLTFVGFVIKPKEHMKKYRKAFVEINTAMLEYEVYPEKSTREQIVKAICRGERYINVTYEVEDIECYDEMLL